MGCDFNVISITTFFQKYLFAKYSILVRWFRVVLASDSSGVKYDWVWVLGSQKTGHDILRD